MGLRVVSRDCVRVAAIRVFRPDVFLLLLVDSGHAYRSAEAKTDFAVRN